jgi:hypothetical protein
MVYEFVQAVGVPGYNVSPGAITALNVQIDAGIPVLRLNTVIAYDVLTITFESELSPEQAGLVLYYIFTNDPYKAPVDVTMKTVPGGGTINATLSIDGQDTAITYLGQRNNEIHISKDSQNNYSSIKAALDAETAENIVFVVHPGTYVENNPLTLRTGCVLHTSGTFENTIITASNPNANIINLGAKCKLSGLTIAGATGASGVYFDASVSGGAGVVSTVQECAFKDCNVGIESDGKDGNGIPDTLFTEKVKIVPQSTNLSKGLYAHNKGQIITDILSIMGVPGYFTIAQGVSVRDVGSKITVMGGSLWFLNRALYVDNGGELEIATITANYNNIGLEVGSSGTTSNVSASMMKIKNSTTYDMSVLANEANIEIHSGVLSDIKINNPNNVKLNSFYHLIRYGRYYMSMTGTILMGSSREPSEMYVGEGHYDIDRVYVLSNTDGEVGAWTDNTDGALSEDAPPFELFAGTAAGNCAYIGRQTNPVGCIIQVNTPCACAESDIVAEYWNGTAWVEFYTSVVKDASPCYTPSTYFMNTAGTYQVHFGLRTNSPLAIKVINGKSAKWVRLRVVNMLPSVPELEMMKPHPNSSEIDSDGFIKYFGDARIVQKLAFEYSDASSLGNTTDQSLYIGKKVGISGTKNSFGAGVLSAVGFTVTVPRNTDTSFPLKLDISHSSTVAGNVVLQARYAHTDNGSTIYTNTVDAPESADGELLVSQTVAATTTSKLTTLSLDIRRLMPNIEGADQCVLWIALERDGTNPADTCVGSLNIHEVGIRSIAWSSGSHLLSY